MLALCACGTPAPRSGDRADTGVTQRPIREPVATSGDSTPRATDSSVAGPIEVLHGYYAAIGRRDFARAYADWGDDGPPGHPSLDTFSDGFARTDSVRLDVGTPGRIEGAAGSRYVEVPVTVHAFERGGRATTYAGSYVLRRSVVPGASEANRRWHLYRATLAARP
ncbi:MAG TPA: hypothetical protein VL328_15830 [Gemmatimonadaceae bacterium]|jgi:hypothetical protein|nr:hypothetical protein [Gemmatimonadaceae bacterium]